MGQVEREIGGLSIINHSDLFMLTEGEESVFVCSVAGEGPAADTIAAGAPSLCNPWEDDNEDEDDSPSGLGCACADGFGCFGAERQRLPDHQDRHQPFFVKMKEGAEAKAAGAGRDLKSYAGKVDGDHDSQVAAVESCIADGAKGILIAAFGQQGHHRPARPRPRSRPAGHRARHPLDPADAADATFATDNLEAGRLIGAWAAATLGDKAADAKIAFLT